MIRAREQSVRAEIPGLPPGFSSTRTLKHLAGTRVLLEFEQIHNLIFGSQIFLLKKLNEVAGQGKPIEFVANHFEHVKGLFPEQLGNWSLGQYLAFLIGRLLITTKGNIFHITTWAWST